MNTRTRIITATALAVPLMTGQLHATAVIAATEPTQILNNIQLVGSQLAQLDQLAQQVQMVTNQINQYNTMLRQLASLPSVEWSHVTTLLTDLRSLEASASGFAYSLSNWDTLFNAQHPDFASYLTSHSFDRAEFTGLYTKWNKQNEDAVKASVETVGKTTANFATEESTLETINSLSNSADGQKQVLQAGNKFAMMLNQQVLLLKTIAATQVKMQGSYIAQKNEQEAAQQADALQATKKTRTFVTGAERRY